MAKCILCKKKGLFLKLNKNGFCEDCNRRTFEGLEEKTAQEMDSATWADRYSMPVFEDGSIAVPQFITQKKRWYTDLFSAEFTLQESAVAYQGVYNKRVNYPVEAPCLQDPRVNIKPDLSGLKVGDRICFKREEGNLYSDYGPVYARDKLIGYLKQDIWRSSVRDAVNYGSPIWGFISKIDGDNISVNITHYRPLCFEPAK